MSYTGTTKLDLKKADIGSNQAFETSVMNANWTKVDDEAVAIDSRFDDVEGDVATLQGLVGDATVRTVSTSTDNTAGTDAGNFIRYTSSSATTVTVTNTLTAGQFINVVQTGSGQVTFAAGSGVTLNSVSSNKKISAQHGGVSIICIASGVYQLIGSLAA